MPVSRWRQPEVSGEDRLQSWRTPQGKSRPGGSTTISGTGTRRCGTWLLRRSPGQSWSSRVVGPPGKVALRLVQRQDKGHPTALDRSLLLARLGLTPIGLKPRGAEALEPRCRLDRVCRQSYSAVSPDLHRTQVKRGSAGRRRFYTAVSMSQSARRLARLRIVPGGLSVRYTRQVYLKGQP